MSNPRTICSADCQAKVARTFEIVGRVTDKRIEDVHALLSELVDRLEKLEGRG